MLTELTIKFEDPAKGMLFPSECKQSVKEFQQSNLEFKMFNQMHVYFVEIELLETKTLI